MPRPPITPEQRKKTRERIRQAASTLRTRCRLEDITARAVAAEAGVSVGTIYSYFGNLEELAQSLWQDPVEELREKMRKDAKKVKDPVKRIRRLLENYARFADEQNTVFRRALLYVRPETSTKPEKTRLEDEVFFSLLHDAIIEGQEKGKLCTDDPRALAQTLWASVHGSLALPATLDRIGFDPAQKMAKEMIEMLMKFITKGSS